MADTLMTLKTAIKYCFERVAFPREIAGLNGAIMRTADERMMSLDRHGFRGQTTMPS